ncbi:MAG: NAD(P)/FAD-dependent oxidoreductase [Longimicrobiaceae bacterium]
MNKRESNLTDVTVIGGGPTGLFAAFYAGLRGASCRLVDALPELGGQLMALYPEKYVYDVGGYPKILAKELAKAMIEQGTQFDPEVVLGAEVESLVRENGCLRLVTGRGEFLSKTVVITGGKGALNPQLLDCPGWHEHYHESGGVRTHVKRPEDFRARRVLIVGGGDSAVDWVLALRGIASEVTLVHRRHAFRAHRATVDEMERAAGEGEVTVLTPFEVREIHGEGGFVNRATVFDNGSGEEREVAVDVVIALLGFKPDLGTIGEWGLELERNSIKVSPLMETNLEGVYAAGDITHYPGKLELIATGYGEAAIAVNNAVHFIDPKARVNPGHSTHLKVFKQDG